MSDPAAIIIALVGTIPATVGAYFAYKGIVAANASKLVSQSNAQKLDTVVSQKVTAVSTQQLSSAELEHELARRDAEIAGK